MVTDKGVLALLGVKDGKLEQVTARDSRVLSAPSWSADGAKMAVLEFGGPGEVALTVHDIKGGGGQQVPLFWNPTKRGGGKKKK